MRLGFLTLFLCFVLAPAAFGWNKPGHMIVGAIAYDVLKQDSPETLTRVLDILRHHPQYDDVISRRLEAVPEADRDRYLFMVAARWPDDIRNNKQYHHGPWHYIDYPIVPAADEGKVKPEEPHGETILTALKKNSETLKGGTDDAEKAIAVCWLIHLIGDIHQPLHTVSLFTADRTKGDRGGNEFYIRVRQDRAVINLHSLWDGLLTGGQTYRTTGNIAIELRKRSEFAREKFPELLETDFEKWAKNSAKLAREVAYQDGTLQGGTSRDDGPVLPDGYTTKSKAIAERQVMLAGYRLAEQMELLFPN